MLIEPGRDHMLFDGDCGICTWFAQRCERADTAGKWRIAPYQDAAEKDLGAYGVTWAECARSLHVITRTGRVRRGAFAANAFLWQRFPWSLLVTPAYAIPVFLVLELIGYRLVANNRQTLSRWFGLQACRVQGPAKKPALRE